MIIESTTSAGLEQSSVELSIQVHRQSKAIPLEVHEVSYLNTHDQVFSSVSV